MKEKDNQTRSLIIGVILCIIGLILSSWYTSKVASIEYVDKKCQEIKTETEKRLDKIDEKLDKLIDLHMQKK